MKEWLDGYKAKIETVGFRDEIQECKDRIKSLEQEEEKLSNQLEKAFTLVEQGIYTLEVFKERREELTNSIDEIKDFVTEIASGSKSKNKLSCDLLRTRKSREE